MLPYKPISFRGWAALILLQGLQMSAGLGHFECRELHAWLINENKFCARVAAAHKIL